MRLSALRLPSLFLLCLRLVVVRKARAGEAAARTISLVPDAVQRAAVHCRAGTFAGSVFETIPGLQRITSCCAAPGKRFLRLRTYAGEGAARRAVEGARGL
jgi:hypothetical protein